MIDRLAISGACGLVLGKIFPRVHRWTKLIVRFQYMLLGVMLVLLGMRLGVHQAHNPQGFLVFAQSLCLCLGAIGGSFIAVLPFHRWLEPPAADISAAAPSAAAMAVSPQMVLICSVIAVGLGTLLGLQTYRHVDQSLLGSGALVCLCGMLFLITLRVGGEESGGSEAKKWRKRYLVLPPLIALGSIGGGAVTGYLLGLHPGECAAVTAGCGWYSLTSLILAPLAGEKVATWALLANLFREILSFIIVPLMARYHRGILLLTVPGTAMMDSMLLVLGRLGGKRLGVLAFLTGLLLSLCVPVMVPLVFNTFGAAR